MYDLTGGEIRSYARSCRVRVTALQLSNWRKKGLLGPHRRPGLGRGRGRKLFYWQGAQRLAVFLARGLRTKRDLKLVGWQAWLRGYPVADFARARMLDQITGWEGGTRHQESAPKSASGKLPETWPLYRALFLGLAPRFSDFVKHESAFGRRLPTRDYARVLRKLEQPGEFIRVDTLRRVIIKATDRELENARDNVLVVVGVLERILGRKFEAALMDPGFVLMFLALAAAQPEEDGPAFGDFVAEIARKAMRHPLPPESAQLVTHAREIRKGIRRARRKAQLL